MCQPAEYKRARLWSRRAASVGIRSRPVPWACRTTWALSPYATAVRGPSTVSTSASQTSTHASHSAWRLSMSVGSRHVMCSAGSPPMRRITAAAPPVAPAARPAVAPSYHARTPTSRCAVPWMHVLGGAVRTSVQPWLRRVTSWAVHEPHAVHLRCSQRAPAVAAGAVRGGGMGRPAVTGQSPCCSAQWS